MILDFEAIHCDRRVEYYLRLVDSRTWRRIDWKFSVRRKAYGCEGSATRCGEYHNWGMSEFQQMKVEEGDVPQMVSKSVAGTKELQLCLLA
ncbi:hypothetical protein L1987_14719 [Smallanthus sonchifolius]|uniref:Uncharacterized protein n=1 Tax=Smallanthus sonchifolius TaxID=185202 RepID=A0ACB9J5L5_9ASTR|nr:hypothetical protein L1987_14719 [Smallanthus sonchifolius]